MLDDARELPTITTARLALRWLVPDDIPALWRIFGDPEVCRYWSRPALPDLDAARALHAEIGRLFEERSLFQWGVAERASNSVVGTCTLAALSAEHRRAEVGFALAREAWGRGYVAEMLPALVGFAFQTLGLHRLEADVDPRNTRSIRALERVGFQPEGYQRERYVLNEEVQDARLYGLLRHEWTGRRPGPGAESGTGPAPAQVAAVAAILARHWDADGAIAGGGAQPHQEWAFGLADMVVIGAPVKAIVDYLGVLEAQLGVEVTPIERRRWLAGRIEAAVGAAG